MTFPILCEKNSRISIIECENPQVREHNSERNSIYVNIEWQISDDDVHKRLFMNFFHGLVIELKMKIDLSEQNPS